MKFKKCLFIIVFIIIIFNINFISAKAFNIKTNALSNVLAISIPEKIAQTAERLAWPLGTSSSKYDMPGDGSKYKNAKHWNQLGTAKPTKAFQVAMDKWYPNHFNAKINNSHPGYKFGACCCHSTKTIVSEALGKKMPNSLGSSDKYKKYGFSVTKVSGNFNSKLKRGDILRAPKHTLIYIGDGKVVEGSLSHAKFSHVAKKNVQKSYDWVYIIRYEGDELVDGTGQSFDDEEKILKSINIGMKYNNCKKLLGDDLVKIIKYIFLFIKIITPVILVILSMVDFIKAIINEGDLNKALSRFIKRAIIAICIFLIPVLCEFIMDITGISDGVCGIN